MYDQGNLSQPLVPPDAAWDPAEELAWMLQEAMEEEHPHLPPPRDEDSFHAPADGTTMAGFPEVTTGLPPLKRAPGGHRRIPERARPGALQTTSCLVAALAAAIASAVSFFSGLVASGPLQVVAATRVPSDIVPWWPLLLYGPWLVASLSVLRAALHQRRALHSWCTVLLFSSVTILLCVLQAPRTLLDITTAALPGLASLACFQQAVRQITLTRAPRKSVPRHRTR
ncbi:DUF2637 domain-containing protein [Streptomyces glaucescens]|uniref:Integral membrane protein n=1 Tax=Streptomyces glaucescens TaxID=1907 RepID=A0A089Z0Z5_STRGA|nr:DUF2637 domain-containing protein [Streptomyces glaucescens]AIR99530.1 integral membrane protein [Streptomyces glaucescens]